jgi:hypothetical protein
MEDQSIASFLQLQDMERSEDITHAPDGIRMGKLALDNVATGIGELLITANKQQIASWKS